VVDSPPRAAVGGCKRVSAVFGIGCIFAALAQGHWRFAATLTIIGVAALTLTNATNSMMQQDPAMRGQDKTHFNRAFLLQLGPAMFQVLDGARQIEHGRCLACHRSVDTTTANIYPLRWPQALPIARVWEPGRTGIQFRIAVVKKAKARQGRHKPRKHAR
jgi:hypothetical protein